MSNSALYPDNPRQMSAVFIASLRDDNPDVRETAQHGLLKLGEAVIPALIEALYDPNGEVRFQVAQLLCDLGWQPYDEHTQLLFALANQEWDYLVSVGQAAIPACEAALRDDNFYIRSSAALTLGEIHHPAALPLLKIALRDSNNYVRSAAIKALSGFGTDALHYLGEALLDEDKGVRREASSALTHLGAVAVPILIEAFRTTDWYLRREVGQALIAMSHLSIPALVKLLKDDLIAHDAAQLLREMNVNLSAYGYSEDDAATGV